MNTRPDSTKKSSSEHSGKDWNNSQRHGLSLDTMLEILADPSRRQLLVALDEHNLQEDDIEISADVVTSGDKGAQPTLQMVHTHLPKLADAELIEWDQQTHQVREGPHFDEIQPLVEMVQDHMNNRPSARD